MMTTIRTVIAFVIVLLASQAGAIEAEPGSVFEPIPPTFLEDEDVERESDLGFFISHGYSIPNWRTHERFVDEIAAELVVPDYVKRTERGEPDFPSIDVASAFVTGGDFNDMFVMSRLPGDCTEEGCLPQVWTTSDGRDWKKSFERRVEAFAYRPHEGETVGRIVRVGAGDDDSTIFEWTGWSFLPVD